MATWPVDPHRVVLLGHSNGGYMAYRLASSTTCEPTKHVAVLHSGFPIAC